MFYIGLTGDYVYALLSAVLLHQQVVITGVCCDSFIMINTVDNRLTVRY